MASLNFSFKNISLFAVATAVSRKCCVIESAQIEIEIADQDSGLVLVSVQTNKNIFPSTS